MFKILENELGEVTVTPEVVETIAGLSAMDCYGLVGMVPHGIQDGIGTILKLDSVRRGVEVTTSDEGLMVEMYCIVGYGVKISEVGANIIQTVSYTLEKTAGIPVKNVNINIEGIRGMTDK